jgi:PAS domain S-box-containing protein
LPIRGGDGQLLGIYNAAFETTDLKMPVRRSRLLHRISAGTNLQEVTPWKHIVDVCQDFDKDIPMLVVYSTVAGDTAQSHQLSLQLEGSLGMERGHGAIPEILELHDGKDGFIPALQTARLKRCSTFLEMPDGRLPDFLAQDVRWRCFEGPPTSIVITPLFVTGLVAGFLIIGTNPRRPSDETHKQFVESLGHVSTELLCSSVSYEQARAREVNISRELTAQEKFIRKVAEVATVGLFNQNMKGLITWANSRFYAITGISEKPEDAYSLLGMDFVLDEDKAGAIQVFEECISLQIAKTTEFRLKKKWVPPGSVDGEYCWILASATPSVEDGEVTGVMGCVTDISHLKWAEQLQINTAEAAKEAKRQQERFIDTTSHEIRNPLSAILQCADGISTVSQQTNMHHESDQGVAETFDYILESARTILFCVVHQKRIVDDILTVSKLDSSMLAITPVCVDPSAIVMQALEMVETELSATDIHSNFSMNQSYIDLNVKYVYCDPTRLTQILVNLLTNALKFTKTAQKREIRVRVGASTEAPRHSPDNTIDHKLQWFPSGGGSAQFDARDLPPMGTGEEIYISFEVQDTGRGISGDEMSLLFNRFSRASPKTHVQVLVLALGKANRS